MEISFEPVDFGVNLLMKLRLAYLRSELWIWMSDVGWLRMIFEKGVDFGKHVNSLVGMNCIHGLGSDKLVFAVMDIIVIQGIIYGRIEVFVRDPVINERGWFLIWWGCMEPERFIMREIIVEGPWVMINLLHWIIEPSTVIELFTPGVIMFFPCIIKETPIMKAFSAFKQIIYRHQSNYWRFTFLTKFIFNLTEILTFTNYYNQ